MDRLITAVLWDWVMPIGFTVVMGAGLIGCACFGSLLGMRPPRGGRPKRVRA
jgi:hypothetical protein